MTRRTFWETRWGTRAEFYVDAVVDNTRTIAVFSDVDLWGSEKLHLDPIRDYDQRPMAEIHCCGSTHPVRGYPCDTCHQPFCPACQRCRCDRAAEKERMCTGGCYLKFQPHLLVDGVCEECRSLRPAGGWGLAKRSTGCLDYFMTASAKPCRRSGRCHIARGNRGRRAHPLPQWMNGIAGDIQVIDTAAGE
jgi:hypothetical protein